MKYGIELEFFVKTRSADERLEQVVPAYRHTNNLDGEPVIGELRTGVHDSITDCVFELKKLLFLEKIKLKKAGLQLVLEHKAELSNEDLKSFRKDALYLDRHNKEILEEFSIYPVGDTGKLLPRGHYKASLQINFSDNKEFSYTTGSRNNQESKVKVYSEVFNYVQIINKLDEAFSQDISNTERVPGVYAIKNGTLGKRIEYRSLPNNIRLDKLIEVLNG